MTPLFLHAGFKGVSATVHVPCRRETLQLLLFVFNNALPLRVSPYHHQVATGSLAKLLFFSTVVSEDTGATSGIRGKDATRAVPPPTPDSSGSPTMNDND